jgi:hypothetical protein
MDLRVLTVFAHDLVYSATHLAYLLGLLLRFLYGHFHTLFCNAQSILLHRPMSWLSMAKV